MNGTGEKGTKSERKEGRKLERKQNRNWVPKQFKHSVYVNISGLSLVCGLGGLLVQGSGNYGRTMSVLEFHNPRACTYEGRATPARD